MVIDEQNKQSSNAMDQECKEQASKQRQRHFGMHDQTEKTVLAHAITRRTSIRFERFVKQPVLDDKCMQAINVRTCWNRSSRIQLIHDAFKITKCVMLPNTKNTTCFACSLSNALSSLVVSNFCWMRLQKSMYFFFFKYLPPHGRSGFIP